MGFESFQLAAVVTSLDRAPQARPHADLVEFRMDLATDPLAQLEAYDGSIPLLATNRRADEGGNAEGPDRLEMLKTASRSEHVVAIDIELATVTDGGAETLLGQEVDTIISWHDFEGTPSQEELRLRLDEASSHGTVGKVAVTANDPGDVLRLLTVTHECEQAGQSVATMAMGAIGRHSRVVAPLYGSRIGYAPISPADATAPGQFDLETMAQLIEQLQSR